MTPAEILRAAKEKISDPARWCQGSSARNSLGYPVNSDNSRAAAWCAQGAVAAAGDSALTVHAAMSFLNCAAGELMPGYHPSGVNDLRGHADVMAMFDRAIALAEES